jgi:DNA-binding response OmpR family regulator
LPFPSSVSTLFKVTFDDALQQLTINGRKLRLGRQEYLVAKLLYHHYVLCETGQRKNSLVSFAALCQVTGTASVRRLHNLVSEVRSKLLPHEVDIKSVRGDGYYFQPPNGAM